LPPLTAAKERSAILRLPAHMRTDALNKLSSVANASGGAKRQYQPGGTVVRPNQTAARGLRNALGIYLIEVHQTGPLAANVGGATPATITIEGGTPASTAIAANEMDAVTWAAPGPVSMTVQVGTELAGNTKVTIA
jgi:archaellum component FlaG (FlaF/FlaG flagellin family)